MLICIVQTNIVIENYGSAAPLWKRQARVRTSRAVHPELVQTHMYYDGFVYFFSSFHFLIVPCIHSCICKHYTSIMFAYRAYVYDRKW